MKKNVFLFSLLIVFLCASFVSVTKDENSYFKHLFKETEKDEVPQPHKLMGKIIDQTIQEIKEEYEAFPIGIGMSGKFKGVSISLYIYRPLEKNEARKIVFDCAQKLLKFINSSKEIEPYLEVKPFNLENIGITIYSVNEIYEHFSHPNIAFADIGESGLEFGTKDKDQEFGYKEVSKESFEEARAKIAEYNAKSQKRQVAE